jgi:hypothetical protein
MCSVVLVPARASDLCKTILNSSNLPVYVQLLESYRRSLLAEEQRQTSKENPLSPMELEEVREREGMASYATSEQLATVYFAKLGMLRMKIEEKLRHDYTKLGLEIVPPVPREPRCCSSKCLDCPYLRGVPKGVFGTEENLSGSTKSVLAYYRGLGFLSHYFSKEMLKCPANAREMSAQLGKIP